MAQVVAPSLNLVLERLPPHSNSSSRRPSRRCTLVCCGSAAQQQGYASPRLSSTEEDILSRKLLQEYNLRTYKLFAAEAAAHPWLEESAHLLCEGNDSDGDGDGDGALVLTLWTAAAAEVQALRRRGAEVVAVQPERDTVQALAEALALDPPDGIAHDGWERYASPRVQLYRGNPWHLYGVVLALAGRLTAAWDRSGLLHTPPELLPRYASILGELLPRGAPAALVCLSPPDEGADRGAMGGGGGVCLSSPPDEGSNSDGSQGGGGGAAAEGGEVSGDGGGEASGRPTAAGPIAGAAAGASAPWKQQQQLFYRHDADELLSLFESYGFERGSIVYSRPASSAPLCSSNISAVAGSGADAGGPRPSGTEHVLLLRKRMAFY